MDIVFAALVTLVVALAIFNGLGSMRLSIALRRAKEAEMSLARAQLRIDAMAATIARQAESLRLQDAVRDAEQASHQALIDAAAHAVIQLEAEVARLKNGAPAKLGIDPWVNMVYIVYKPDGLARIPEVTKWTASSTFGFWKVTLSTPSARA